MNAAWQSDTCPEVRTSRPRDRKTTTNTSMSDQMLSLEPANSGTNPISTTKRPPMTRRTLVGAYQDGLTACALVTLRSASRRFGVTISTMNRTMNGSPSGRLESQEIEVVKLLASAPAIPISRPPR